MCYDVGMSITFSFAILFGNTECLRHQEFTLCYLCFHKVFNIRIPPSIINDLDLRLIDK